MQQMRGRYFIGELRQILRTIKVLRIDICSAALGIPNKKSTGKGELMARFACKRAQRVMIELASMALLFLIPGCTPIINRMAFFPEKTRQSESLRLPAGVKEIFIVTADRKRLQCFYLQHPAASKKLAIYFHGNAGNIYQRIPELYQIAQVGGASVLGVGYRGFGKSSGRPSEAGIYRDGEAALAYARDSLGCEIGRIFIVGRSIGSAVAAKIGALQGLAGVILITPLTTGKEYISAHGLGWISFLAGNAFNVRGMVRRIASPVLIIHGTSDAVTPFAMGEQVFAAVCAPKRFVAIPNGRHNELEFDDPQTYWGAIREFLAANGN